tara:strand:+ start:28 stop:210 length:183 start_codon:yes stop_codon:yes gene_type:complete
MSAHEELDILIQALEANLKILDKCSTSNIKDRNLIMLSVITELRTLCDKVIIPLKESIDI